MAQGNSKANKWAIVINAKKSTPSNAIDSELEALLCSLKDNITYRYFFAIIHNKDILDTGEPKRTHLHIVLELKEKATFSSVLSTLTSKLGIDKEQISLEPTNSQCLAEQYLIHKNDSNKHQYSQEQVITNDKQIWLDRLNKVYLTPEEQEEENKKALYTANNMIEFIERAGLDYANRYRGIFRDIRADRQQDVKGLETALTNERIRYENLIRELEQLIIEIDTMKTIKDIKQLSLALSLLIDRYKNNK